MLIDPVLPGCGKEFLRGKLYGLVELSLRSGGRDKLDRTGHGVPLDTRTYEDETVGRVAPQCGDDVTGRSQARGFGDEVVASDGDR